MKAMVMSELRKLFTIRSTFITALIGLGLVAITSFYVEGVSDMGAAFDTAKIKNALGTASPVLGQLSAVVIIIYLASEYRYNTIFHTIIASNSRLKVVLAKFLAIVLFSITFGVIGLALGGLLTYVGATVGGHNLPPQAFGDGMFIVRNLVYILGYTMYAGIVTMLLRSLAAPIAIVLIASGIEQLAGLVLEDFVAYLPFRALEATLQLGTSTISSTFAMGVVAGYLIVGWTLAAWSFIRRDAN